MDEHLARRARGRAGVLTSAELGLHASRAARRSGLVPVQPRTWVAGTQPVGAAEQVASISASVVGEHAFAGLTALWLYGLLPAPAVVDVAVAHRTRYRAHPPARVKRLRAQQLVGSRRQGGRRVVALEVAIVQAAVVLPQAELTTLLEDALRRRLTTLNRVRARCRRGVPGSAAVRRALDSLVGQSLDRAVRRLVAALEERGVTGLVTEARFVSEDGASAYADVLDERGRTVLELDGFLSHTDRQRFRADRRRDRWMHAAHGLVTFRIDVAELDDLGRLADELAGLLLARRAALRATG